MLNGEPVPFPLKISDQLYVEVDEGSQVLISYIVNESFFIYNNANKLEKFRLIPWLFSSKSNNLSSRKQSFRGGK